MNRLSLLFLLPLLWIACQPASSPETPSSDKEYYELRVYSVSSSEQQQLVLNYWRDAAIPGLNRQGISPIGVFTQPDSAEVLDVFVWIPYDSPAQFAEAEIKLQADAQHNQAGAAYLNIAHPAKAFERITSTFMVAFDSMPWHSVPALTEQGAERFFELRSYESYSEKKGLDKIRMFNEGREVAIFEEIGTDPVFFAQAISGDVRPNLVYMTTFSDTADHRKKWNAFRTHPQWVAIKDLPEYAHTVSKIDKYFLHPTAFSQL